MHEETLFDLASLTKPLATALSLGVLAGEGAIDLNAPLSDFLPAPPDKAGITLRQLLSHSSGLPAFRPYFHRLMSAPEADRRGLLLGLALEEPLESLPGEAARYSDVGYILLGAVAERASGVRLDRLAEKRIFEPLLGTSSLHFRPRGEANPEFETAATESCPRRGKVLVGEVHDESCWAAGGVCGHAGLFGKAGDVALLLLHLRRIYLGEAEGPLPRAMLSRLFRRQAAPPGTDWGLGFDHPSLAGSSAGRHFSKSLCVGHLGFTGCSFWMDLEHDLLVVLLSNRVHPSRENDAIRRLRPRLHDAVFEEVFKE
jgi:CubicO group peptidase (beta-lactamase class C family)